MAEGFVRVAPDSTGKKLRSAELTVGANDVHQEVVTLADADGTLVAHGIAAGTKANVAASASSVTLLASSATRVAAMVYNDSSASLYLDLTGGTASSTSFSVLVPANSLYELPTQPVYTGLITGIWSSAVGSARVTSW